MLIGVMGKAGAGKDTIADYLVKEYKFKKISLADPIKRLVKDIFVLDDHTVYDRVAREKVLENWPDWSVRKLLQYIGTELFRNNIDQEIWVKSLWYRVQDDRTINYVCPDVRFPNELQFFKDHAKKDEFISIRVVRAGCDGNVGINGHASEAYDLIGDYEIINNGSFEELHEEIGKIVAQNKIYKENL